MLAGVLTSSGSDVPVRLIVSAIWAAFADGELPYYPTVDNHNCSVALDPRSGAVVVVFRDTAEASRTLRRNRHTTGIFASVGDNRAEEPRKEAPFGDSGELCGPELRVSGGYDVT